MIIEDQAAFKLITRVALISLVELQMIPCLNHKSLRHRASNLMGSHILSFVSLILGLSGLSGCGEERDQPQRSVHPPLCGERTQEELACLRPWLPFLDHVHAGAQWTVTHPQDIPVKVGYTRDLTSAQPSDWYENSTLQFSRLGWVKIFVIADAYVSPIDPDVTCEALTHEHIYEVVDGYDPRADAPGSLAISSEDTRILSWGSEITDLSFGPETSPAFQDPERALGEASGGVFDVMSLGRGGEVTYAFDPPVANGPGPDFAIFENSFSDLFLELARVEVSTDGDIFVPLPHAYLGDSPVGGFGEHDPSQIFGLAGKYRAGYGTPFDLSTLAWHVETQRGVLDLSAIHFIRIIDIIGDGRERDSFDQIIYDPYPTEGSAGFDLDALGVLHTSLTAPCPR